MLLFFAAEEGHAAFDPLHVEGGFIFWSAITFAVLIAILWKIGWGPLSKTIHDREVKVKGDMDGAAQARAEAESALTAYKKQLDDAALEIKRKLEEARQASERLREDRVAETEREIADMKGRALKDIETARAKVMAEIRSQVVEVALAISQKVVSNKVDAAEHKRMADTVLSKAGDVG